jgi:hypothetical protein
MSARGGRRLVHGPSVILAGGTSCAVVAAGVLGALSAPVVVAGLGMAGVIALVSYRGSRYDDAELLAPIVGEAWSSPVTVAAPKAREVAAQATSHSDAA